MTDSAVPLINPQLIDLDLTAENKGAAVRALAERLAGQGRVRRLASAERMLRWASSAPSGAAIMKIRSAGPSGAPKSTPRGLRAKARLGWVTWAERACGMPIPPSRPVGI